MLIEITVLEIIDMIAYFTSIPKYVSVSVNHVSVLNYVSVSVTIN